MGIRFGFGLLIALVIGAPSMGQTPLGTSITYQGQLRQAGAPASDSFSLDFSLWDADVDGNLVAGPVNRPDTPVTNGLFNVLLDFPPEVFTGARLWLEVVVDGVPLMPRQEITPVPYALSVPGLAMSPAGVEVTGDMHATGDVIASAFSSNSPLIFKVNPADVEVARFDDVNYFFGVGTAAPQARLHIGGAAGVDGLMFPDGTLQTTAAGTVVGGDSVWSLAAGGDIFYTQGNVGIGTTAPASKLDIAATGDGVELLRLSTERPWVFRQAYSGSGTALRLSSTVGLKNFEITAAGGANVATFFASDLAGNLGSKLGIGTTNPLAKLDIAATGDGAELLRFSTERPWVFRQIYTGPSTGLQLYSTTGQKRFEITTVEGINVATFLADGGNSKVGIGTTTPASRLDIVAQDALGITGFQPFLTLRDANAGNARGRIQNAGGALAFFSEASFASGTPALSLDHFTTTTHCADFKMGHALRRGTPGRAIVDNGSHLVFNFARDWGYTAVHGLLQVGALQILGGADLSEQFDVEGHGQIVFDSDEESNLRESTTPVEPGVVVCIDAAHPGKLVVCGDAYDQTVAGVISGAGGVNPGMTMGQEGSIADGQYPVALTGRVYAQCDARGGAIRPGDLLTTSDTPGHAMKAVDRERSHGAVIGKAMTSLERGERGLVFVLVNLQ